MSSRDTQINADSVKYVVRRSASRMRRAVHGLRHGVRVRSAGGMTGHFRPGKVNTVRVEGWAHLPHETVLDVLLEIDGDLVACSVDRPTPELAVERGTGAFLSGWQATVPVAAYGPPIEVRASMRTATGLVESLGTTLVDRPTAPPPPPMDPAPLERAPIIGDIDGLDDGFEVGEIVVISGWALTTEPLDRIEVFSGMTSLGRARLLAKPRGGLDTHGDAFDQYSMCGFELVVSGAAVNGRIRARVDAGSSSTMLDGPTPSREALVDAPEREPAGFDALRARSHLACRGGSSLPSAPGTRLLVVTHDLGIGGGQLYLQDLLRGLLTNFDLACTVVAPRWGVYAEELQDLGARVELCGAFEREACDYEGQVAAIGRIAVQVDANVLLANTVGSFVGVDVAGRRGIPSIWAIHESYEFEQYFYASYQGWHVDAHVRESARMALAGASATVFEADATRELYAPRTDPAGAVTIRYGIELDEIDRYRRETDRRAARSSFGVADDEVFLVCVGTIEPRKSQAMLLDAFRRLSPDGPPTRLALVGSMPTDYCAGVDALVEEFELQDRVTVYGVSEDIWRWYLAADALVSVSDVESLPRSVLEVMAFETPVLATAVFGVPEVVEDGVTGLLCEPRDIAQCTDLLRRFLAMTPERRAGLGLAAGERARRDFDASGYVSEYRALIAGLVADTTASAKGVLGRV